MERPDTKIEDMSPDEIKQFIRQISYKLQMSEIMSEEEHFIHESITQEFVDIYNLIKRKL